MSLENLHMECLRNSASAEDPTTVEFGLGPPLPYGWEQCLDLKSGVVYFKNLETGDCVCSDPLFNNSTSKGFFTFERMPKATGKERSWDDQIDLNYGSSSPVRTTKPVVQKFLLPCPNLTNDSVDLDLGLAVKNEVRSSSCSSDSCISVLDTELCTSQPYKRPLTIPSLSLDTLSSSSTSSSSSSSPSVVSFQGDSEDGNLEVDSCHKFYAFEQEATESMIAAGCVRCLMYVMLPRARPICPKCGHAVLMNFLLPPAAAEDNLNKEKLHTMMLFA